MYMYIVRVQVIGEMKCRRACVHVHVYTHIRTILFVCSKNSWEVTH